jgi:hypothetical protein
MCACTGKETTKNKKQNKFDFPKEKEKHSIKRWEKSKLTKIPQFKSVKALVIDSSI